MTYYYFIVCTDCVSISFEYYPCKSSWTTITMDLILLFSQVSSGSCRPQHLSGLEVVRDLCHGILDNASVGSTKITFKPKEIQSGSFTVDTKTAG